MTRGFDQRRIAAALVRLGYLAPDPQGKTSKLMAVPSYPKQRLYHFVSSTEGEHDLQASILPEQEVIF
jgi:hypothetical protein